MIRLLAIFSFNLFSISAFTQCPLDLGESSLPPEDDLLLYFPFDGTLDNLGDDTYTATVSGAEFVESGCGQGLDFDGDDDFVTVTPSLYLTEDYTVTAWINADDFDEAMGIFSIREQCVTTYRGYSISQFNIGDYLIETLNNQLNKHIDCTGWSAGDRYTNDAITIPAGEDVFVALTVTNNISEDRVVKLYVNCEEYETEMTIDFPTDVCFDPLIDYVTTIGASSNVAGEESSFNGIVDEVRVYDRALSHLEMLDVYHHCRVVEMEVEHYTNCGSDSAMIVINNAQLNVEYQLYDITNDVLIGPILPGDCDTLFFFTAEVTELTQYEIIATSTLSGCAVNLDSVITLSPEEGEIISEDTLYICEGDSILINDTYVFLEGTYSDTFSIEPLCDSIVEKTIIFYTEPFADFTFTYSPACFPIDVNFFDESISDSAIISWIWNFGDLGVSDEENPVHTYMEPGDYLVSLEVETINGCADSFDSLLSLEPYEVEYDEDRLLCPDGEMYLYDEWISEEGVYVDTINFSPFCDSIITTNVSFAPIEEVIFSVADSVGCYPLTVSFENETDAESDVLDWTWEFGDGLTSDEVSPEHTYETPGPYDVRLELITIDGCMFDTIMTLFYPNYFVYERSEDIILCEGESFLIDGEWIDSEGTYFDTIPLAVNCDSIITYDISHIEALNVDFSVAFEGICLPVTAIFTDETTVLTGDESWFWEFGDGTNSYDQHPSHVYELNGTYSVSLIVTSGDGCVYEFSEDILIDAGENPFADFSASPLTPFLGDEVFFTDLSINASGWNWFFGDGATSADQNPIHTYDELGAKNVMLIVKNGECYDTAYFSLMINEEIIYYVPNTFTPDGDDFNDNFLPVFTSGYDPYDYHLTILNRWGEIIFESYNAGVGWDGTFGGEIVQDGVYIWTIEFGDINNDERHNANGHVTVLK